MNWRTALTAVGAVALGLFAYSSVVHLTPSPRPQPREGSPAPRIELTDVSGQRAALAQYKGRVVLLDFWATWCDSCTAELPELRKLYDKYRPSGFEILAASVDADGRRKVVPYIAEHSIPWRVLLADADTTSAYRVWGLPAKFLIDPEGLIARRYEGPVDPRALESEVRRLLKMPSKGDS
jgi:peroxiredoxin